jgi:HEPN domain-containing protein
MSDPDVGRAVAMWLRYAREDLTAARAGLESRDVHSPRHVCFDAQQAAEKALKARYVAREMQHPFIHDLDALAAGLGLQGTEAASPDLAWLTEWAGAAQYPFGWEPGWDEAERAVQAATHVVEAASEAIG